ncbi:hypothetical protein [Listeria booriae]|uniref:Uncharacterized protein n=1 Tax=Listeria booriae TaxID=1552123 RepID=A0A7X1CM13_9LIST|nr:hypothetical protein [Listeria booriae]MBC1793660.1 hypothetical protein [Listeria booriae]
MKKSMDKIKNMLAYLSRSSWEKRQYIKYDKERRDLETLTNRELSSKYVNTKAKYEYKRNILSFFVGAILLAIFMGMWGIFYNAVKQSLKLIYSVSASNELAVASLIIASIFFAIVVILIIFFLFMYLNSLHYLHRQLLIIEEVRDDRK